MLHMVRFTAINVRNKLFPCLHMIITSYASLHLSIFQLNLGQLQCNIG
jgi:hypothetical protein